MFNDMNAQSRQRAQGALQITMHARAAEKAQALAFGAKRSKAGRGSKGLLANLLAILRIG